MLSKVRLSGNLFMVTLAVPESLGPRPSRSSFASRSGKRVQLSVCTLHSRSTFITFPLDLSYGSHNAEMSGQTHNEGRRVSPVVMRRAVPSICSGGANQRDARHLNFTHNVGVSGRPLFSRSAARYGYVVYILSNG